MHKKEENMDIGNTTSSEAQAVSDTDRVKLELMQIVANQLSFYRYRQLDAAEHLGISQPMMSNLLKGKVQHFSWAKLVEHINTLGWDVDIVVRRPRSASYCISGKTTVIQA